MQRKLHDQNVIESAGSNVLLNVNQYIKNVTFLASNSFIQDDPESLETVGHLRDLVSWFYLIHMIMLMARLLSNGVDNVGHQVMKSRGPDMPMVVAGNKTDVDPALEREQTEALVRKPDQASKFNVLVTNSQPWTISIQRRNGYNDVWE